MNIEKAKGILGKEFSLSLRLRLCFKEFASTRSAKFKD
jgi:hypothetical protein